MDLKLVLQIWNGSSEQTWWGACVRRQSKASIMSSFFLQLYVCYSPQLIILCQKALACYCSTSLRCICPFLNNYKLKLKCISGQEGTLFCRRKPTAWYEGGWYSTPKSKAVTESPTLFLVALYLPLLFWAMYSLVDKQPTTVCSMPITYFLLLWIVHYIFSWYKKELLFLLLGCERGPWICSGVDRRPLSSKNTTDEARTAILLRTEICISGAVKLRPLFQEVTKSLTRDPTTKKVGSKWTIWTQSFYLIPCGLFVEGQIMWFLQICKASYFGTIFNTAERLCVENLVFWVNLFKTTTSERS